MSISEAIEKASHSIIGWLVVTAGGALVWIIRRIFTNQKQIEMLQRDLSARETLRNRDREDVQELKNDVKELRADIKNLFQNYGGQ